MWRSNDQDSARAARAAREDAAVRRLLEAAGARPDEIPTLSPYFTARVRAAAAARVPPAPHPLAAVAWHALPALVVLLAAVSAWAAFETVRSADAQDDAAMVVLASREPSADAPLAALLLSGGGAERPSGGGK
jgi:hypothetical protein